MDIIDIELPTPVRGRRNPELRAGSGACTSYIDENICEADNSCYWRQGTENRRASCALRPQRTAGKASGEQTGQSKRSTGPRQGARKAQPQALREFQEFLQQFRAENPNMTFRQAQQAASSAWHAQRGTTKARRGGRQSGGNFWEDDYSFGGQGSRGGQRQGQGQSQFGGQGKSGSRGGRGRSQSRGRSQGNQGMFF